MKPKYSRFLRTAFPSLVIIPAMAQFASAAVIAPDGFGNVLITSTDSGANHILVAAPQPAGQHEIRFDSGTSLTPDGAASIDLRVLAAGTSSYKITLGTGSAINGGANAGITTAGAGGTAANLVVNATGSISGASGILGGAGLITVTNDSSITGTVGAGINSTGTIDLINNFGHSVTGNTNGVVGTGVGSFIGNYGTITGQNSDGVVVGDSATINNWTTFNFPIGAIFGGRIVGSDDGIFAGDNLKVLNQELGSITGTLNAGIYAGDNANITNDRGASITGGDAGIDAGDGLVLNNAGTITGQTSAGVYAGADSQITNSGTISGNGAGISTAVAAVGPVEGGASAIEIVAGENTTITNSGTIISSGDAGIRVLDSLDDSPKGGEVFAGEGEVFGPAGTFFTLNNSGLVQGVGAAFLGGLSDDTLNLNYGSQMIGDVIGGGGIDTINFGSGLSSPGAVGNYIQGDVIGFDSINKASGGVALIGLPGDPLYNVTSDSINITGGGLYINADIAGYTGAKATINAGGAALGGTGLWNANINVTGFGGFSAGSIPINLDFNPGNAVGAVTITGDVVHASTSFIRYDFVPQGGATDFIRQTGVGNTYDMGGGYVRLSATNNNRVLRNGSYVIVQSDEAILGTVQNTPSIQFNQNVSNSDTGFVGSQARFGGSDNQNTVLGNYFSNVAINGKQIELTVLHDFSRLATSSNAAAVGNALDASINSLNPIAQDFIAALDYSDLGTVQATLSGLAPDTTFAPTLAVGSGNYRLNRLVQDHLATTRTADGTSRSYVGSYSAPESAPAPQPRSSGRGNVWGTASYSWNNLDSNTSDNFDGEDAAFTAGVDYRVAPDFLLGLVLDGSTGDYDYSGGNSDVNSFRAAIYGTYGKPTGFYSDFLLGYGTHSMDQNRYAGPLLRQINSDTDADSFQAMLTAGYTMQAGNIKHGPYGGLEYQKIDVDGYKQGGAFPIGVDGYDVDSFRLLAGYRVEGSFDKFTPYASVAYAHEFQDDNFSTSASIPGGAQFSATGSGFESAILISVGTSYSFTPDLSMNVGYHGEISVDGGSGADSNGASIGLNYEF